ncbi:MAG: HAMP domain-containing protein [Spirochaetales bacterium]|nr:HAMP domain-containing protein [Spirochaetales bacterium]
MKIRSKIILVVVPVLILFLGISGMWAYFSATSGITRLANSFLSYKVKTLREETEKQWGLLVDNNLTDNTEMIKAAQAGVTSEAINKMESPTELIFAVDKNLELTMRTNEIELLESDKEILKKLFDEKSQELKTITLGGVERVGRGFYFEPFGWFIMITEQKSEFFKDVNTITYQTAGTLIVSIIFAVIILYIVAQLLTKPLTTVVNTMKEIITDSDLTKRVPVEFQDETGELAHTFNLMVGELGKADRQIRKFALDAVLSQKRESKIRNIFQRYVPQELIDKFFENPGEMLVGDNRVLSILFSDIRDFTTISERLPPDEIVNSLNRYFSVMVDIIFGRKGIVDKYIGDAIMAFFGAPVRHEDDALQSVMAGLEMTERVLDFNRDQVKRGMPAFHIGVGINYGFVTVGNIGTEKKMDYTVIGDMVNLASRLEGLTKDYKQKLLFSESLQRKIKDKLYCREIDRVAVKGRADGIRIFTTRRELSSLEREAWEIHNNAMEPYYAGQFQKAAAGFRNVLNILKDDHAANMMYTQCVEYEQNPPAEWTGVRKMDHK